MEIDPSFAEGHAILGISLAQTGRYDESIDALRDAVRYAPGNPSRLAALAWGYAKAGGVGDANQAMAHWASHYWMAMGQTQRSLEESEEALSLDPTDA